MNPLIILSYNKVHDRLANGLEFGVQMGNLWSVEVATEIVLKFSSLFNPHTITF